MDKKYIAPDGPFKLSFEVMMVGVSGEYEGYEAWAKGELSPGIVPTPESLEEAIKQSIGEAGEHFRLATRHEFVAGLYKERTGMNLAVEGPDRFSMQNSTSDQSPKGEDP